MYDYNNYNSPEKGNKHIYAYGAEYESLNFCGFIRADNKRQAMTVLRAHNRAWNDNNVLLDYTEAECNAEYNRRKAQAEKGPYYKEYMIIPLKDHPYGYLYNVQIWVKLHSYSTKYYTGTGKYCKTVDEVKGYITECKRLASYKDGVRSAVHFDRDNI